MLFIKDYLLLFSFFNINDIKGNDNFSKWFSLTQFLFYLCCKQLFDYLVDKFVTSIFPLGYVSRCIDDFFSLYSLRYICVYIHILYAKRDNVFFWLCAVTVLYWSKYGKIEASDLHRTHSSILFSVSWETIDLWSINLLTVVDNLWLVVVEWLSNKLVDLVAVDILVENVDNLKYLKMVYLNNYYVVDLIGFD